MFTTVSEKYYRAGGLFLSATLLLISLPRSWSLYPLGFFLFTGLLVWIKDFNKIRLSLSNNLFLIVLPVIYFLLHLISVVIQSGSVKLLTDRLMFLLIPIFGFPLFVHYSMDYKIIFLKSFICGIILASVALIIRIIFFVNQLVPDEMTYFEYALLNKYWFFSAHLSVFEHPTYFSMKIIWVLIIFMLLPEKLRINRTAIIIMSIFLSIILFFLASRAAIILWVLLILYFIRRLSVNDKRIRLVLILIIPAAIALAVVAIENPGRINDSIGELRTQVKTDNFQWKNIDQRTREWYNAMQLIKKNPIAGVGLVRVQEKMREEYYRNGFYEEAKLNLNAHNQFLEAQMTFGIAGTLSLLFMLLAPLIFRKRLRYPELTTGFILMISFFLMFESMFNRQWGIMFFLLFYFILGIPNPEKEDNIAPDQPL